ncbi:MAG: 4-hydroxy-tetrahydrodipicolinate synthase [Salinivirgaceae bacterium]
MNANQFKGTGVALITPFRKDESIDFNALERLVEKQIANKVNFLVALGTTSEAPTLSSDEKAAVVDFIIEINKNRLPLVVGCGGNNTRDLVHQLRKYNGKAGVDGILSVAPYYNKPNQTGLYEHFKALANACQLPIILYNVPGRTGSNIAASTAIKLAKNHKNIVAIKEASGDFKQAMELVKHKPAGFLVLSGDDALALPLISLGFDGIISVVANAFPDEFSSMVNSALKGDFNQARTQHYRLIEIIHSLFEEGNPAGVKAYMVLNDAIENSLRLPLVPVSKNLMERIKLLNKNLT